MCMRMCMCRGDEHVRLSMHVRMSVHVRMSAHVRVRLSAHVHMSVRESETECEYIGERV